MIDWVRLLYNAAWLSGLSLILAGWSFFVWQAHVTRTTWRAQLNREPFQVILWSGLALVALGLAGTADQRWERWLLALLALLSAAMAVAAVAALRARRSGLLGDRTE